MTRGTPDQIYRGRSVQSALLRMKYCIENNAGLALLMGASGAGKSTLLRCLRESSDLLRPFVHLLFPALKSDELLRLIADDMLIERTRTTASGSVESLLTSIYQQVLHSTSAGCHSVICFDDAHQLSDEAMTSVVLPLLNLSDLPTCRLSVILSGQPLLSSRIRRHHQIAERVGVSAAMEGFTQDELSEYIQTSLVAAGASRRIFSSTAEQRLFEVTAGNPRRVNRLCDMALLVGCAENLSEITSDEIDAVSTELIQSAA